jgi:hypothetical protein
MKRRNFYVLARRLFTPPDRPARAGLDDIRDHDSGRQLQWGLERAWVSHRTKGFCAPTDW